jgi:outer membrane protein assembly factor BamE (lipoprotein component of BamABCDE complex)
MSGRPRQALPPMMGMTRIGLAAAVFCGLAGCTPERDVRGILPDQEQIAEITPGQTRQDDVTRIMGTPTAMATFDREIWYYIGERTETVAFFKPEVKEHRVVVVRFDKQGVVEDVRQVDATKEGKNVALVPRETPTKGKELTLIQQLLGNVGRFNKKGEKTDTD